MLLWMVTNCILGMKMLRISILMMSPVTTGFKLTDSIHNESSLTVINGWLTTVGGYTYPNGYSNELFSLRVTGEVSERNWPNKFPPMPTKRRLTT